MGSNDDFGFPGDDRRPEHDRQEDWIAAGYEQGKRGRAGWGWCLILMLLSLAVGVALERVKAFDRIHIPNSDIFGEVLRTQVNVIATKDGESPPEMQTAYVEPPRDEPKLVNAAYHPPAETPKAEPVPEVGAATPAPPPLARLGEADCTPPPSPDDPKYCRAPLGKVKDTDEPFIGFARAPNSAGEWQKVRIVADDGTEWKSSASFVNVDRPYVEWIEPKQGEQEAIRLYTPKAPKLVRLELLSAG